MTTRKLFFRKLWDMQNLTMLFILAMTAFFAYFTYDSFNNEVLNLLFIQILFISVDLLLLFVIIKIAFPAMKDLWYGGWKECGLMGFNLFYQKSTQTIRTMPENYYVATVNDDKTLTFQNLEAKTKNIDHTTVIKWFKRNH